MGINDWKVRDKDSGKVWHKDDRDECAEAIDEFGDTMDLEIIPPDSADDSEPQQNEDSGDQVNEGDTTSKSSNGTRAATAVQKEPPETETQVIDRSEAQIQSQEEFVTEIKGVPETFVVNMGTAQNKSIHIKKEGYYYLASKMGIEFGSEPIKTSVELDGEKAVYRGWAERDGQRWENVGTAHLPGEDMKDAEYNLDELAATRAACRALSMATGTGVASMEEMVGEGP